MKILVACNTFKEAVDSVKVCECVKQGLLLASKKFTVTTLPLADGGTGTAFILTKSLNGRFVYKYVSGPLPKQKVKAKYGIIDNKIAVVELAEAAGLRLVPESKRNPLITTTKGVGELIYDAVVNHNVEQVILGIGDSATIDCGIGALSMLGFKFVNKKGEQVELNCSGLLHVDKIVKDNDNIFLKKFYKNNVKLTIACDVTNKLTGKNGVLMFAKQKGAKETDFKIIDKAVKNYNSVIKKEYKIDLDNIQGSGAAGGIGASMKVLLNAELIPGFEIVSKTIKLEEKIKSHDLIITGEGKIDKQTLHGKTVARVLQLAKKYKKPVICIAGWVNPEAKLLYSYGVVGIYSITMYPMTLQQAIKNTTVALKSVAESIGRTIIALN